MHEYTADCECVLDISHSSAFTMCCIRAQLHFIAFCTPAFWVHTRAFMYNALRMHSECTHAVCNKSRMHVNAAYDECNKSWMQMYAAYDECNKSWMQMNAAYGECTNGECSRIRCKCEIRMQSECRCNATHQECMCNATHGENRMQLVCILWALECVAMRWHAP